MPLPQILSGLHEIASDYDSLVCDVWGVLHNGQVANPPAVEALRKFRERGKVVLLSNAPRSKSGLQKQFQGYRIPPDCYDEIVTSGIAARLDLEHRKPRTMFHLGPERDAGIYRGLGIEKVDDIARAEVVLNSGLFDDEKEAPDDYKARLAEMKARDLLMLCANPDWQVQRGGRLIWCAGALADAYEKIGGKVIYFGKPLASIYELVRQHASGRMLAIGDGLRTDIKGANAAGIDALFIADGIHGEDVREMTGEHLAGLFDKEGVRARAAMRTLSW